MKTKHDGGIAPSSESVIDAEMRALADGWATVNDPLSNATIDITKQCVNVSLSCDGSTAVGPPRPSPHAPWQRVHSR